MLASALAGSVATLLLLFCAQGMVVRSLCCIGALAMLTHRSNRCCVCASPAFDSASRGTRPIADSSNIVRVALFAVRLFVARSPRETSAYVLEARHRLQMFRVHAKTLPALMVKLQPLRNRAVTLLPDPPMSESSLGSSHSKEPVSSGGGSCGAHPQPASSIRLWTVLGLEPLDRTPSHFSNHLRPIDIASRQSHV
jgi:hypothetical protein